MAPPNDLGRVAPPTRPLDHAARPDAAALQPNIGALVHDVARLIRRRFEKRAREAGLPLTRHQARALLLIARNEGLSQATVATMLDIEPIALVRVLDRLREERLVERRPHATDRRVRTLWLTELGWGVTDRLLKVNEQIRQEACAGLPPAVREMLLGALAHMKGNLTLAEEGESLAAE